MRRLAGITDEDDLESLVLAYNPKFRRLLLEAEKRVKDGQGIKHESFWKAVERKG
jgi:hypothetical protein